MRIADRINRNGDRPEPDPARVEATLGAIDAALETDRINAVDLEERRLQELALGLRAEAAVPRREFTERMDERVGAGFSSPRPQPPKRVALGRLPRPSLPALAGAASVLAALAVAISLTASQGDGGGAADDGAATGAAPPAIQEEPAPGGAEKAGTSGVIRNSTGPPGSFDLGRAAGRPLARAENRRVERSAKLALAAPGDELQDVAEGIAAVVDRHDGFLLSSSLTTGEDAGGGTFELRVPVEELDATLADLSGLATVRGLTQSADDRTAGFVERQDTLEDAEAKLEELQSQLAVAETFDERQAIRAEIRSTRDQIKDAGRALERIRTQTSFTTITVTLEEGDDTGSGLGGALDDATGLFEDVLGVAVRALGVLVPLALIVLLGWAAGQSIRRRRRESALA
jgi:hypothetical protein